MTIIIYNPGIADTYAESAEFIDVLSHEPWRRLGPVLHTALAGVDPRRGPVVDVGAGTGLGTLVIADALPDTHILAVEPSAGLRAVLLAKLAASDDLRRRVTVLHADLHSAELPPSLGAVVAMNMLGHLDPAARQGFWSLLATRLAPGAPAVLNLGPPTERPEQREIGFPEVTIGRRRYGGSGWAEPTRDGVLTWHMTYRVTEDGRPIARRTVDSDWYAVPERMLRDEVTAHHLRVSPVGPAEAGVYMVRDG